MDYAIVFDNMDIRKSQVQRIMRNQLMEKYDCIRNVTTHTLPYISSKHIEFNFIVDAEYSNRRWADSYYNRMIKKDVYNLCKYILGEREVVNNIFVNVIKPDNK